MAVYLLHFNQPFHHAKYYIGYSNGEETVEQRIERHRAGNGARLLRAVSQAGIEFKVARIWESADRNFERKLKSQKNAARYCPICKKER